MSSHAGCLGSLRGRQRRTVIKDRHVTAEFELGTDVVRAVETLDEAAPLIMNVKRRHEVLDHPRLARLRLARLWLAEWAADPLCDRVAFVVSGEAGPLAITFAYDCGRMLEIYQIGLTDEPAHRHAAYVQSLVHAPLAHAMERIAAASSARSRADGNSLSLHRWSHPGWPLPSQASEPRTNFRPC